MVCLQESGEESMKTFMDKYDKNSDGRIELAEVRIWVVLELPSERYTHKEL